VIRYCLWAARGARRQILFNGSWACCHYALSLSTNCSHCSCLHHTHTRFPFPICHWQSRSFGDDGTADAWGHTGNTPSAFDESAADAATPMGHLQATMQHAIFPFTSHTISFWDNIKKSIIFSFMQMEWNFSGVLRPPHVLSPTNLSKSFWTTWAFKYAQSGLTMIWNVCSLEIMCQN